MIDKIEVRERGVFAELSGIVTSEELFTMNNRFLEELRKKPYEYQLVYFRDIVDFVVSTKELREIALQDMNAFKMHPVLKIATVSTSKLILGVTRMYDVFSSESTASNRIFETLEEAERWVEG
jgi:hypothetical protein